VAFLLCLAGAGCAGAYQVKVNGYTDPAAPGQFPPGARFAVLESPTAPNPLLEREIKAKIERLLTRQGFSLAPYEQAEYVLRFTYGTGPGQSATVIAPDWGFGFGGGGRYWGGGQVFFWPGFATYSSAAVYDHWLLLNVLAAKAHREGGASRPLWVGESRSSGRSASLREVVNPLLVAAFEQFGKNTGKAVAADLPADDPRLKELEQVR
jgi:hypothetical protein